MTYLSKCKTDRICTIQCKITFIIIQKTCIFVYYLGSPTISNVTLSGDSKTLTCTSTGGPATTVVWRQNCIIIQQNNTNYVQNQVVTSTLTATYDNTLEISNATGSNGVYTCSVGNSRGYVSSSFGVGSKFK